jgi:hypothetical protein
MNSSRWRERVKNRREKGRFILIPHNVLNSDSYIGLNNKARVLLIDLCYQYNGRNNGDLTAALGYLKDRGWVRHATLHDAVNELIKANLIQRTREGRFQNPNSRCALYSVNWLKVDECPGKDLEVDPTLVPRRSFSLEKKKR